MLIKTRLPRRFDLEELNEIEFVTAQQRYPLTRMGSSLVAGETARIIKPNNRPSLLFYPKLKSKDTSPNHIFIFVNGFDEKALELFLYYNRELSLSKLISTSMAQHDTEIGNGSTYSAFVLMPIPFHHWRRPIKGPYESLNSSQMIYDNAIRLYLGFEQFILDTEDIIKRLCSKDQAFSPYSLGTPKIHLVGYSIGGLGALCAFLRDRLNPTPSIATCHLLASGVNFSEIDLSKVRFEEHQSGGKEMDFVAIKSLLDQFYLNHPMAWRSQLAGIKRDVPQDENLIFSLFERVVLGCYDKNSDTNNKIEKIWADNISSSQYLVCSNDMVMPQDKIANCVPSGTIPNITPIGNIGHYLFLERRKWWDESAPKAAESIAQFSTGQFS